ncbi:MAG: dTMP kinase [Thermoplasmata archaeon]|nr:dTMP kinase [Thermoplasmata archaeon]
MTGSFVTLEGIDGCGKSTVARKVSSILESEGVRVELTREPTDTWLGKAVKRSHQESVSPFTEVFLFMADRATHTDWVREKVSEGALVISDRYSDSTVAYQSASLHQEFGGSLEEHADWLLELNRKIMMVPDLTILLDIDPETSLGRLRGRKELSKFEHLEYLGLVRDNYLMIAKGEARMTIIDATGPIDDVVAAVLARIKEKVF